jgi:hypothetical protein
VPSTIIIGAALCAMLAPPARAVGGGARPRSQADGAGRAGWDCQAEPASSEGRPGRDDDDVVELASASAASRRTARWRPL